MRIVNILAFTASLAATYSAAMPNPASISSHLHGETIKYHVNGLFLLNLTPGLAPTILRATGLEKRQDPPPKDSVAVPGDPVPSDPVPSDPVPSDPVPGDPVPKDPVPKDPVPKDPVPKDPVPKDPVPSDPVPSDPVPSDPVPSDPVPSDPVPSDPVPQDPVPSDPVPTDPAVPSNPAFAGFAVVVNAPGVDFLTRDTADVLACNAVGFTGNCVYLRALPDKCVDSIDSPRANNATRSLLPEYPWKCRFFDQFECNTSGAYIDLQYPGEADLETVNFDKVLSSFRCSLTFASYLSG